MNSLARGSYIALLHDIIIPDMQGRVLTTVNSLNQATMPLGMLFAGPFADVIGIRTLYMVAGVTKALIVLVALFVPAIMRLESN